MGIIESVFHVIYTLILSHVKYQNPSSSSSKDIVLTRVFSLAVIAESKKGA